MTDKEVLSAIDAGEKIFGPIPQKEVECMKCGNTMMLARAIPLRDSWCKHCRALGRNLRIFGPMSPGYVPPASPQGEQSVGERPVETGEGTAS